MDMKKKEYTKPSIRLVEWNFSEAVCQTITTNSYAKCFKVTSRTSFSITENRSLEIGATGEWNRVGSNRTGN